MPDTEFGTHEWWQQYKQTVNDDDEMSVRGHDRFDENFLVGIDDDEFLIEMEGGSVVDVVPQPGTNDEWSLAVTGSQQAWEEFAQEIPPAHNNELIASNYRTKVRGDEDHLEFHGNNRTLFQNLRPFQRTLDLMREAHT